MINPFLNLARPVEVFYKGRSDAIKGHTTESRIEDLCEMVLWFRQNNEKLSEAEKETIRSKYIALIERVDYSTQPLFLSLRYFLPENSTPKPLRVGLEAEYARSVHSTESDLKYDQKVGTFLSDNKTLALLKLDGISTDKKSAILELECRPRPLDSKEFSEQLQIIDRLRSAILGAERSSNVQDLLQFQAEEQIPVVFGNPPKEIGPQCQVTLELPLSRLGDPTDQAILDLIEKPTERKLLQHARLAADALVGLMRREASKLHGYVYTAESIKLAKLRGYWAQSIMQACQVTHYDKNKERVGFHIRVAGPLCLGARDKALLKVFFETYQPDFSQILRRALKDGVALLAEDGRESGNLGGLEYMPSSLMKDAYNFESRPFVFKVSTDSLELSHGVTLVELRHVHSALNRGIVERSVEAYSRITKAQARPESRPRKVLA